MLVLAGPVGHYCTAETVLTPSTQPRVYQVGRPAVSPIRFSLDRYGLPLFDVDDQKYGALGAWIITDISVYLGACLTALALIDDAANGRPLCAEWSSECYDVAITPRGVMLYYLGVEGEGGRRYAGEAVRSGEYTVDEVREALEAYWSFNSSRPERHLAREYRSDLAHEWQAELIPWEEVHGLPHPYRARLF